MKQQIDKLVKLAKEYVEYAKSTGIKDGWTDLKGDEIRMWLSEKGEVQALKFYEVEIFLFANKIEIPFDSNDALLDDIYNNAKKYLEWLNSKRDDEFKNMIKKRKQDRIAELEKELKQLKEE